MLLLPPTATAAASAATSSATGAATAAAAAATVAVARLTLQYYAPPNLTDTSPMLSFPPARILYCMPGY